MRSLAQVAAFSLLAFACMSAAAEDGVLSAPPAQPDPKAHYLFYLHGAIIEQAGRRPRHPRFGVYEYDAILQALQASGAIVISEQRPSGTAIASYADKIRAQVELLLKRGVLASQIALVGFSKGGSIAQRVSARLAQPELRYVLLGACPGPAETLPTLHGKLLSIRERSDSVPSCRALFAHARGVGRELEIAIGGEHGAFYRPNAAWLEPLLDFVR
ncbi:MAG TPA: alpha/beta hydrolase [Polyangiales bacterium]|nr:alpha/beta hydrolase [Polyangiales bacterium]